MGLTVHYGFRYGEAPARTARALVEELRRRALSLPLHRVGPLMVYDCGGPHGSDGRPEWFRAILDVLSLETRDYIVSPERAYAFEVHPGRGAEIASFGLLRYPRTIKLPSGRRVATRQSGWLWRDFCKTQYASNPRYGGLDNFRRSHLALIALLDQAAEIGLRTEVTDESGFATHRDVGSLDREIAQWNELIAGLVGQLKDALGGEYDAPIARFPNFEHLEARGRKRRP
jgi:hypothetical protein